MTDDKTLPIDSDSDDSLPGRFEEANSDDLPEIATDNFEITPEPQSKNRLVIVAAIAFVIVAAGAFTFYFTNQPEIDSQILQNTFKLTDEEQLVIQYGVGEFGSDHAHAAIAVFIGEEKINFARPQYQLTSKYIHFENNNPYLIHRHATAVPLELLFASFGMKVTTDCIIVNAEGSNPGEYCADQNNSLEFYINGQKHSEISQYVLEHNDRIMISYGDGSLISEKLVFLDTLRIPDVPRKTPQVSPDDVLI